MAFAIETAQLGKRYDLRPGPPVGSRLLREDLLTWLRLAKRGDDHGASGRAFWALRDVNLQVETGEVFGLLGHNGAGKSTLLRLLSRITVPTEGHARIRGRVGTLLEVGTGFHGELTGRENVFLSAAVLGMRRAEVVPRLAAIVEMANVGDFFDVPVKRYSSGMFVRLAFAVAAQLEPEIMLIDEILAVGDAEFRRRCFETIERTVRDGRTVVFVSHSAAAVERVCTRCAYLARGRVEYVGAPAEALRLYHAVRGPEPRNLSTRTDHEGTQSARVLSVELLDASGRAVDVATAGAPLALRFRYSSAGRAPVGPVKLTVIVHTFLDTPVFIASNALSGDALAGLPATGSIVCNLPRVPLPVSVYRLSYRLEVGHQTVDALADALTLQVVAGDFHPTGMLPDSREAVCLVDSSFALGE